MWCVLPDKKSGQQKPTTVAIQKMILDQIKTNMGALQAVIKMSEMSE